MARGSNLTAKVSRFSGLGLSTVVSLDDRSLSLVLIKVLTEFVETLPLFLVLHSPARTLLNERDDCEIESNRQSLF